MLQTYKTCPAFHAVSSTVCHRREGCSVRARRDIWLLFHNLAGFNRFLSPNVYTFRSRKPKQRTGWQKSNTTLDMDPLSMILIIQSSYTILTLLLWESVILAPWLCLLYRNCLFRLTELVYLLLITLNTISPGAMQEVILKEKKCSVHPSLRQIKAWGERGPSVLCLWLCWRCQRAFQGYALN